MKGNCCQFMSLVLLVLSVYVVSVVSVVSLCRYVKYFRAMGKYVANTRICSIGIGLKFHLWFSPGVFNIGVFAAVQLGYFSHIGSQCTWRIKVKNCKKTFIVWYSKLIDKPGAKSWDKYLWQIQDIITCDYIQCVTSASSILCTA